MPVATVRGVDLNYEVLGERGPWVALQPGGRRGLAGVKSLGEKIAEAGCRELVYDRRNCGVSGISFEGGDSENEIWAEDLHALLAQLDALPAYRWQLVGVPPRTADGAAPSHGCSRSLVVARHWRGLRRAAPSAELLHAIHRSRATGRYGSGLPDRAFQRADHRQSGQPRAVDGDRAAALYRHHG